MFFINPVTTIASLGISTASAGLSKGFEKLREHYHLTDDDLKSYATPRNVALATLAAGGVAAVMINPVTRVAICTLLGMTYTMSLITLNLMMIGLYLSWIGLKGLGAAASAVAPMLTDFAKDFFISGYNQAMDNPVNAQKATSDPKNRAQKFPNPPASNLEAQNFEMEKATLNETSALNEEVDELVDQYMREQETELNPLEAPVAQQTLTEEEMQKIFEGEERQNKTQRKQEIVDDLPATRTDELAPGKLTEEEMHNIFEGKQLPIDDQFDDSWLNDFEKAEKEKAPGVTVPELNVDEFLEWQKKEGTGTQLSGGIAKNSAIFERAWKEASVSPVKDVAEEWVTEYMQQQSKSSGHQLLKYAGGALAVGAGVFAAWQLYKTLKEVQQEEMPELTYANIPSNVLTKQEGDYESSAYNFVAGNLGMFE